MRTSPALLSTLTALLPHLGATAASSSKVWTEAELRPHTTVDEAPNSLLIGINKTVYNVTSSPRFYGPGGPYHHFTGRDASRAWVTECWDDEDQLTWRMDGIEKMFMPKYLDELMEDVANGKEVEGMAGIADMGMAKEQMAQVAKMSVDRFGGLSKKERAKRIEADTGEAKQKADEALQHWISFFADKYEVVGTVDYDEANTPAPPPICEKAMGKRPVKGGKMENILQGMGGMGAMMGGDKGAGEKGEMPDFVKDKIKQKAAEAEKEEL